MAFVNYKNTNNASSLLISDITASATTILITDWDQGLFPSSFPFLLTLEHLDANDNVILREIVKVVASNQNTFTIERSAWTCVQDDTATNRVQDNTAHAFSVWDRVSLYWTAEQVADIQNNLELKWNQDSIANVYDNTATYSIGDIVVYNGDRYTCTTAVSTPEDFDSTKWTKVNIQNELNDHETRIDALENASWWTMQVDLLLVWGWWGWWKWYWAKGYWWGGWAWQVKFIYWLLLKNNCYWITIWSWWAWWSGSIWSIWWKSCFGDITAIWWGGWWWWRYTWNCHWTAWWNWWGAWGHCWNIQYWWAWQEWWYPWANSRWETWWGGWWAWWFWWMAWLFMDQCQRQWIWWPWIATCFWWTLRCLWWWWTWWGVSVVAYLVNYLWLCYWWWNWWESSVWLAWTANTWWGGWWWWVSYNWWAWWSWLVIVRYPKDCSYWIACATWWTITEATINWIQYIVHTFTSWWTFNITQTA